LADAAGRPDSAGISEATGAANSASASEAAAAHTALAAHSASAEAATGASAAESALLLTESTLLLTKSALLLTESGLANRRTQRLAGATLILYGHAFDQDFQRFRIAFEVRIKLAELARVGGVLVAVDGGSELQ
jgi:hypothetical protein